MAETIPTLFIREYDSVVAGQAYYAPFQSLQSAFSIVAVLLVMIIYVVLAVLLWNYVKRYVKDAHKPRGYVIFWGMMISWGLSIIYDFGLLTEDYYGNVPFSTNSGLIWLIPIVYILMMGKTDKEKKHGDKGTVTAG